MLGQKVFQKIFQFFFSIFKIQIYIYPLIKVITLIIYIYISTFYLLTTWPHPWRGQIGLTNAAAIERQIPCFVPGFEQSATSLQWSLHTSHMGVSSNSMSRLRGWTPAMIPRCWMRTVDGRPCGKYLGVSSACGVANWLLRKVKNVRPPWNSTPKWRGSTIVGFISLRKFGRKAVQCYLISMLYFESFSKNFSIFFFKNFWILK